MAAVAPPDWAWLSWLASAVAGAAIIAAAIPAAAILDVKAILVFIFGLLWCGVSGASKVTPVGSTPQDDVGRRTYSCAFVTSRLMASFQVAAAAPKRYRRPHRYPARMPTDIRGATKHADH